MTPLMYASLGGNLEIVKELIRAGANVNSVTDCDNTTPLKIASIIGNLDIVKYLIRNGANVNARDKSGRTALMLASKYGHFKIVKYLREQQSKPASRKFEKQRRHSLEKQKTIGNVRRKSEPKIRSNNLKVTKADLLDESSCPICLEGYKSGQNVLLMHGPGGPKHHTCKDCFKKLEKDNCPMCRTKIKLFKSAFGACVYTKKIIKK
jgi:ankyrin repeat protein